MLASDVDFFFGRSQLLSRSFSAYIGFCAGDLTENVSLFCRVCRYVGHQLLLSRLSADFSLCCRVSVGRCHLCCRVCRQMSSLLSGLSAHVSLCCGGLSADVSPFCRVCRHIRRRAPERLVAARMPNEPLTMILNDGCRDAIRSSESSTESGTDLWMYPSLSQM